MVGPLLVERDPSSSTGPFTLLRGDFRQVDIPRALAVYADPPYYGMHELYNCDPVALADLVPIMESIAPVRALSMSQRMLPEALALVGGVGRVCPWVKPWTPTGHTPAITWEPVLLWGDIKKGRPDGGTTVRDSLVAKAGGDNPSGFPTPKPEVFAKWIADLLGVWDGRPGLMVDLFSGSGSISRAVLGRSWSVVGVDSMAADGVWSGDPYLEAGPGRIRRGPTKSRSIEGPVDPGDPQLCPMSSLGWPTWPHWYTNRHQFKPVYYRGYVDRNNRPRLEVPGVKACAECHLILGKDGVKIPASEVSEGRRVFVRVTVGPNKRSRRWLEEHPRGPR